MAISDGFFARWIFILDKTLYLRELSVKLSALDVSVIYCRLRNTSLLGEAAIYRCFCNVVFVVVVVVVVVVIAAAGADVVVVAIVVVFFVNVTSGVVVSVEKQKPVDRS